MHYPVTIGESKTVLYREQCHTINKEVDEEGCQKEQQVLKLTETKHDEKVHYMMECRDLITQEWEHMPMGHYLNVTAGKQGMQLMCVTRHQADLAKVPI